MSYFWESATLELQKELNDPLLRVEYDEITQKYEVLKWIPTVQSIEIPGEMVGSSDDTVRLSYQSGRYSVQASFPVWDGRVAKKLFQGRPERKSAKDITQELKIDREKTERSNKNSMRDLDRETAKDIYGALHPTVYSY